MTIRKLASTLAACLVFASAVPASAAVIWADPVTGTNSGSCGAELTPCRTLQFTIDISSPGDTVRAKAGTYNEFISMGGRQITLLADAWARTGNRNATIIDCAGLCDADSGLYIAVVFLGNGLTITGFTIRNAGGTGIEAVGSVVITQNIVTGNHGFQTTRGGGIAVYSTILYTGSAPILIENNEVFGNTVPDLGGGIFIRTKAQLDRPLRPIVIRNNNIHNNSTDLPAGRGGGIFVRAEGGDGGQTSVTITQNTIQANSNTAGPDPIDYPFGGGLFVGAYGYGTHNIQITNNTISSNQATVGGGAMLFSNVNPTATAVFDFSGNTVSGNSAVDPSLTDVDYLGFGGGLFAYAFGFGYETITVQNNQITGNTSNALGGGIDVRAAPTDLGRQTVTIRQNSLTGNQVDEWGGGIFALLEAVDLPVETIGTLEIVDNTISTNSSSGTREGAPVGRGAGIFAQSSGRRSVSPGVSLVVRDNDIRSNHANQAGGGLNLSSVASSVADPDDPTSVPAPAQSLLTATNNLLIGNHARSFDPDTFPATGSGIFAAIFATGQASASTLVDFNTVLDNDSDIGGGVEVESETDPDLLGNTGAAAIVVSNSIVADNVGFGVGGPLPGEAGVVVAESAGNLSVGLYYNDLFSNSDGNYEFWIDDPTGTDGNLSVNPELDASFVPATCSPVVDAGDPAADFALEPAPNGGRVNMGHLGATDDATASLADINGDSVVDGIEILRLATSFASVSPGPRYSSAADIDGDLDVDGDDLAFVGAQFGETCN